MVEPRIVTLHPEPLTKDGFKAFGQVVGPVDDGKAFDEEDAQLALHNGTPRLYVMRLNNTGLQFRRITHHAKVTQCLGCLGIDPWYMAVAPPTTPPEQIKDNLRVFKVSPGEFIKLECGTWHAGPLFDTPDHMDFYNLELSDTNLVDGIHHYFDQSEGIVHQICAGA